MRNKLIKIITIHVLYHCRCRWDDKKNKIYHKDKTAISVNVNERN